MRRAFLYGLRINYVLRIRYGTEYKLYVTETEDFDKFNGDTFLRTISVAHTLK